MPKNYKTDPTHAGPGPKPTVSAQSLQRLSEFEASPKRRGTLFEDVGRQHPLLIPGAIQTVADKSGALMFGYSSDGGTAVITLFLGDERRKFYASTEQKLADLLGELTLLA